MSKDLLKGQGKDKFARGEVNEAVTCWLQALDSIPPPPAGTRGLLGILQGAAKPEEDEKEDGRVLKMRVALLLNLALAHMRLKKFRQAVGFCDEALFDEPGNVKALYRKADALGELCDWHEAEEAAAKLQASGEEGAKLAAQQREEWRRRRRQADGKQKKMWSAALDKDKSTPQPPEEVKLPTKQKAEVASASGDRNLRKKTPFIDPGSRGGSLVYSKDSDDEPFRPAAD
ncbi:Fkbp59 [Symbiodinium natans]|uniref:Fkbp59 protein n=1 Tax=Symbiodinium natans TaxID=878477 RepID=A0A812L3A9_9DINO|nr:Fkbp59 [Symbiodinium natans]